MKKTLRCATRNSRLALWQVEYVLNQLKIFCPDIDVKIIPITTKADQFNQTKLSDLGGKTVFVKEVQKLLLNGSADFAVHSIKDMAAEDLPGLCVSAICKREDPRDVWISNVYNNIEDIQRAVFGTGSPRRKHQLLSYFPHCHIHDIRGNVEKRLEKCDKGEYDIIILAAAGLKRLGLECRISGYLDIEHFLPAIGQGAIAVECSEDNVDLKALLSQINDQETSQCVIAERAVNSVLRGGCLLPIAAHAYYDKGSLSLHAMVGDGLGNVQYSATVQGDCNQARQLGMQAADNILQQGAEPLLQSYR